MLKSIRPDQARMGMYVHAFEGGWLSHPLWRSRFLISSDKDLDRIRASESGIIIDTTKGSDIAPPPGRKGPSIPASMRAAGGFGRADQARAAELALRSTKVVKAMYEDCRLGRDVTTTDILSTVDDIADSLNNMAAFISVTRLKAQDDATYTHSVAVCALMISMARELGLPPEAVHDLGMAGLLHDIGKVSVNPSILLKAEALTDAELAELRRHPTIGHEILSAAQGIPAVALDVCLHHHERPDGSGYPFGLKQDAISQATRMASVCDVYDAMTSIRPYSATKSPLE
ncbi:MAG TPA: HD-GYP domain-containing protein, partial [Sphingomonas sp.]|nr:HD-GYP domain-containing protein [Sphingomonas sp.]